MFYSFAMGRYQEARTFYLCQDPEDPAVYPTDLTFLQRFSEGYIQAMAIVEFLGIRESRTAFR
jgi:hypothetical protein